MPGALDSCGIQGIGVDEVRRWTREDASGEVEVPTASTDAIQRLAGNAVTRGTAEFIVHELMARRAL